MKKKNTGSEVMAIIAAIIAAFIIGICLVKLAQIERVKAAEPENKTIIDIEIEGLDEEIFLSAEELSFCQDGTVVFEDITGEYTFEIFRDEFLNIYKNKKLYMSKTKGEFSWSLNY